MVVVRINKSMYVKNFEQNLACDEHSINVNYY